MIDVNRRVLPGFGLSLGYTMLYLSLLVGVPMAAGFLQAHRSFRSTTSCEPRSPTAPSPPTG